MSRVYFIHDALGDRQLDEHELPLPIGGPDTGGIVLPGVQEDTIIAHIGVSEGHAFIQPGQTDEQLFHNHEHLTASKWLKSGDLLEIGDVVLHWKVLGDKVDISIGERRAAADLAPPSSPPPAETRVLPEVPQPPQGAETRRFMRPLLFLSFVLLLLGVGFVLLATPIVVSIQPEPEKQSVEGFPPPVPFGGRLLLVPGAYTVVAESPGHYPLRENIVVDSGGLQAFEFVLSELPGRVTIDLDPQVPFKLFVNDEPVVPVDGSTVELNGGTQRVRIETERYLAVEEELLVLGKGQEQTLRRTLKPAWANATVSSQPPGATLRVDGEVVGKTPLELELLQGRRQLELTAQDHKPLAVAEDIRAGVDRDLGPFVLEPLDGRLTIGSEPEAASVSVGGVFRGVTPLELSLASGTEHQLQLTKPGYRAFKEELNLGPGEERSIDARLRPEYGIVFVTAQPADARLQVDGRDMGRATQRLRLTTRSHSLVFSKQGYVSETVAVTPRAGVSRNVDVKLKTVAQAQRQRQAARTPKVRPSAAGGRLQLVRPQGSFRMGASRREAGRRANESARLVRLTRPFYLSANEVSNAEYRRFRSAHSSGSAEGNSLDAADQPVVNISWEDAARYCNWLSKKDGLPPAYVEAGGKLKAVQPLNTGYRLPTEAEWAYVARRHGRSKEQRYPWNGGFPPTAVVGNFADASIADALANTVANYNDGYRVSAPVGSFAARPAGFHDLGGNVAEWMHDYYAVYPGEAQKAVTDPAGPADGTHHVVRDSSWRHGTITELRLSYRDYSRSARADLGFRVARYAN